MAKLTFEDLSGSTPAMLWPEEFAKMEDLVKNDQIVFVRGTLDRRRDPRRADRQPDHPAGAGPRRADPRRRGAAAQGVHQPEHLERLLRAVRIRPGNLDLYLEIVGLEGCAAPSKGGGSLAIRYDERLIADLGSAVGPGDVRLAGQRGATARIEVGKPPEPAGQQCWPPPRSPRRRKWELKLDDSLLDLAEDA